MRDGQRFSCLLLKKADLPLEVALLLIAGMTMLIAGILLFPVSAGALPFYENGLYGLFLFIIALQIVTLGKTPFGDLRRSGLILAFGVTVAAIGIITCFVPDIFSRLPRTMLCISLGPGAFLLLLQMCVARGKLRIWIREGGFFRHLIAACSMVYLLSMAFALIIWKQSLPATPVTAIVAMLSGAAVVYLAFVLRKIYGMYPEAERPGIRDGGLSTDQALILLTGIFMLLLGVLLIPVSLGILPFAGSAQLGLLMVIFAVQMLASGNTPIGPYPRSWLLILSGLSCAALGIISCIIPGILVRHLTALIGIFNILGGILTLWKTGIPRLRKPGAPDSPEPPVLKKLFAAQLIMSLLSILFGISMFASTLIPGPVIGAILAANGCVLLYLVRIIVLLDRIHPAQTPEPDNAEPHG